MIIFLIIWAVLGVILYNASDVNINYVSKKQAVFLLIIVGPIAWAAGCLCLVVFSFEKIWKLLK